MTPELPFTAEVRRLASGLSLEVVAAGNSNGSLVILLHGFPDLWQGWHLQIEPLVAAGYRVLIPNQRGYGRSDKPQGIAAYDLDLLANDVLELADTETRSTFHLVGHDWGGIVGWWVAARAPNRVQSLTVLNAPHPGAVRPYLYTHPTQLLKSWYVGFFQLPWLPEALMRWNNFTAMFQAVKATSQPRVFDESDRRYLTEGWSQPGALPCMLNYYRALVRRRQTTLLQRVTVPTQILFSRHDPTEEPGLAIASQKLADQAEIVWFDDVHHWLQREATVQVNAKILTFLGQQPTTTQSHDAGERTA